MIIFINSKYLKEYLAALEQDVLAHLDQKGRTHSLIDHLLGTAELAVKFAAAFDSSEWAELAALLHDFGKSNPMFQRRLYDDSIKVQHAFVGTRKAMQLGEQYIPIAMAISGHHGGLKNLSDFKQAIHEQSKQADQLLANASDLFQLIQAKANLKWPTWLIPNDPRQIEFWSRMLFSCLVDADFLDTERFFNPEQSQERIFELPVESLEQSLNSYLKELQEGASDTAMNRLRASILQDCKNAAALPRGFFSLAVPTGGGKTLSSMAFALRHSLIHELDRVIVVIPYTSIIEQTADIYRRVFGGDSIIEHHSNLIADEESSYNHLASENWDARVVVTTSVQFFESLFANKTSRCRKLHNIARSVILFDEVQTFPPSLLESILDGLKTLVGNYGASVVFCTATQPAFHRQGVEGIREIIPKPEVLFRQTESRVTVHWPDSLDEPTPWSELAKQICSYPQAIAIVHKRDDAKKLTKELDSLKDDADTIHLSASMCAAHRLEVIARIKDCLRAGEPLHVVSTQLVEAGVDIDFPVVFRALAGMESMAQASGRCNREGLLDHGEFFVFVPDSKPPVGVLQRGEKIASGMIRAATGFNLFEQKVYEDYFRRFYHASDLDAKQIQKLRAKLEFAEVANRFQMIDDQWSASVIVPFDGGLEKIRALIEKIDSGAPIPWRRELRALQRYSVSISKKIFEEWREEKIVIPLGPDVAFYLAEDCSDFYSSRYGLMTESVKAIEPLIT